MKILSYWKPYEIIWLLLFCGMAVYITVATGDNLFGFFVFLSGVLCVLLAAKGSIMTYIVGIFNTVGYAWLAWQNGLFGEVGLNMLFYMPMNFIGFFLWKGHMDKSIVRMRRLNRRNILTAAVICVVGTMLLGLALSLLSGQNTPYLDASTNVLSVVATFLMIWRFREQWACYIILNVLSVIMWGLRWADGSPDGLLMVVMWSAYLVNAVYGMYNWTKGSKAQEAAAV
ncbi:MAG: nicotinamide riboside transporter PnuC [Candidatus Methanoplasma sp.]|jgi:nicotinamide mononucleotide transporter|nr:nicotinamide riboside transporter PnuC [Candidatus Methanoplasma sp.]